MPTFEALVVSEARNVARLSRRCASLRKQLKLAEAELRHAKKMLKKIAGAAVRPDPFDQTPPMRTLGE
jgi:multidrug resistance efflux pump